MSTPRGSKGSGPPLPPRTQPQLSGGVPRPLELASTGAQEDGSRLQAAYNVIIKGLARCRCARARGMCGCNPCRCCQPEQAPLAAQPPPPPPPHLPRHPSLLSPTLRSPSAAATPPFLGPSPLIAHPALGALAGFGKVSRDGAARPLPGHHHAQHAARCALLSGPGGCTLRSGRGGRARVQGEVSGARMRFSGPGQGVKGEGWSWGN